MQEKGVQLNKQKKKKKETKKEEKTEKIQWKPEKKSYKRMMFCSYFQVSVFIKLPFPPGKVTATDVTKTVNNLFEKMSLSIFK